MHWLLQVLASYWLCAALTIPSSEATSSPSSSSSPAASSSPHPSSSGPRRPSISLRLPGHYYESNDDDFDNAKRGLAIGRGREFDLFDTRGGHGRDDSDDDDDDFWDHNSPGATKISTASKRPRRSTMKSTPANAFINNKNNNNFPNQGSSSRARGGSSAGSSAGFNTFNNNMNNNNNNAYARPTVFQTVQEWWTSNISPNIKNWPRIQCRVEPTTTLKIRKTFRPLKTIVRFGADFNTQLGVWQFKSSWEDAIIGGKITLAGRELQLSKSWQLSVGAVEDLVTRLRFRAAVDLTTWKAYARVGFRTERLSPINIMEGFTLLKQLPLDGNRGNVKLEVKANFALPEPEIEYSTESHRSLVGMGDIEVNIDELNLVLDY